MGTRRRLATVALLLFAAAAFAAGANAEVIQSGDVRVSFLAKFAPTTLPRETPAPITVEVGGKISTTDGSPPPALRNLRVELNSAGRIEPAGLPSCEPSLLQSTDSASALARCGPAKVGDGTFEAQLRFGGKPLLVKGQALVFNSTVGGRPGMLIHIYIAEPARVTFVIPLKISHKSGEFGTVLTAHVPTLVGGLGSVTELRLRIGRQFRVPRRAAQLPERRLCRAGRLPRRHLQLRPRHLRLRRRPQRSPHAHPQLSGSEAGRIGVTVRQRNRRGVE